MSVENDPRFTALKSRLQQNPDSLLFARVAEGLLNHGQVEEAIRVCEEGIRKHPYYVTGHMVLGKCYLQKKLFDMAEKEFKRVLLFDPKYVAAHKFYGDLMREVGWENTCEMSYRKILQIDPLDRSAREMLETLENIAHKEQKVSTPEKAGDDLLDFEQPRREEPRIGSDAAGQFDTAPEPVAEPEPPVVSPKPTPTPAPLHDDLFSGNDDEKIDTSPLDVPMKAAEDDHMSGILEDIFDEKTKQKDTLDDASVLPEIPLNDNFGVHDPEATPEEKEFDLPAAFVESESTEKPATDFGGFSEEETIEFDAMRGLGEQSEKQPKPEADAPAEPASMPDNEADASSQDLFEAVRTTGDADNIDESVTDAIASLDFSAEATSEAPMAAPKPKPAKKAAAKPEPQPKAPDQQDKPAVPEPQASLADREKIVTPTLGEIYAAQGQYAKAINVFETLLKNDPENSAYQEKIAFLQKRLEESENGE